MKKILFINGTKGGIGNSLNAALCLDYFLNKYPNKVSLIDTDTSNPDLLQAYEDEMPEGSAIGFDINEENGRKEMFRYILKSPNEFFIVNPKGGDKKDIENIATSDVMTYLLNYYKDSMNIYYLWVLDGNNNAIKTLQDVAAKTPHAKLNIIYNSYFLSDNDIQVINQKTNLDKFITNNNGKIMKFPIIQEEFYDYLIDKNIPVHKWSDDGDPINICELDRIREIIAKMYDNLIVAEPNESN